MDNFVLISSPVLFKQEDGKDYWFITKNAESNVWEFPRTLVRKVESSVRASIRMLGEQGAMTVRVLEEAGRAGGVTTLNGKTMPQRHIYYLITHLSDSGEAIGFDEFDWMEFAQATKKLASKREKMMLKQARAELKIWRAKEAKKEEEEAKRLAAVEAAKAK